MKQLNSRIRSLEMPERIRHLPISAEGYPIPFFVPYFDGKPEFRGFDPDKMRICARLQRCWLCGEPLGKFMAFVIGPMCAVNRTSAERLDMLVNGTPPDDALATLHDTAMRVIESGYRPGNKEQGYVLRKLLRRIYVMGGTLDHPVFDEEVEGQKRLRANYLRLRDRHSDKSPEWWFDTHGIDVAEMREIADE
jgi:hypothetical protein